MNPEPQTRVQKAMTPAMVVGIGIIVIGLLLTLDNLAPRIDIMRYAFKLWPLILVGLGFVKVREASGDGRSGTGGFILMGVGAFFLLVNFGHGHVEDLFGPLIVVAVGVGIVMMSLKKRRSVPPELQRSSSFIQGTAILSGLKRRVQSITFKGGEMTAIFGGFELDLRQVTMEGDSARLDAFVLFGGGEVKVPETWEVVNQMTAIAGGVEDKTSHILTGSETRPRLVLTGMALFGGLELRN